MKKTLIVLCALLLGSSVALAGEKKLMHCFTFSTIDAATPAEWAAFAKATDELPGKVTGLSKVWHGKLVRPLGIMQAEGQVDPEVRKKLGAGEAAPVNVKQLRRSYGVCMEFADQAALAAYAKNPAHEAWVKVYEKVRVYGTTTFDLLGQ
jgi:hypothetical protein